MDNTKITVTATIAADPQQVWDYYTLPEHITNWNFASDDWHCPKAEKFDYLAPPRLYTSRK